MFLQAKIYSEALKIYDCNFKTTDFINVSFANILILI